MSRLSRLSLVQRSIVLLFIFLVVNELMMWTAGYAVLDGDFLTFLWIVSPVLLIVSLLHPVISRVWTVRNSLLVNYFLVGVLPAGLILILVTILASALIGGMVSYICQSELQRSYEDLERTGRRRALGERSADLAIVRAGTRSVPDPGPIADIPSWSVPGFRGVIQTGASTYFLATHVSEGGTEAFVYRPFDDATLAQLVSGFGIAVLIRQADDELKPLLDSTKAAPMPKPQLWDFGARGAVPLNVRSLEAGHADLYFIGLYAKPTHVIGRLVTAMGDIGPEAVVSLTIFGAALLMVVLVAVTSSTQLTRSLTRTIHDIYAGTKKIESGDFSHRIAIRGKDQLSELAGSFNGMTERVERLIVEVKEKEKLEAELEIARQVQAQLFPKSLPELKHLQLAGVCKPARVVSGDYYDFISLDSKLTAIVIGDISGKGISAALVMASVQSSLHAHLALESNDKPSTSTLVARLNRQLYANTPPEKYATFYCGLYDDDTGNLVYTNAGHLPPILIRDGNATRLESNGTVVGLLPDFPYGQTAIMLQSGDLLVAFTDGITEAENKDGEQFGEDRLVEILLQNSEKSLDEIAGIVTERVQNWAYDPENQDDTTILLVRRSGHG